MMNKKNLSLAVAALSAAEEELVEASLPPPQPASKVVHIAPAIRTLKIFFFTKSPPYRYNQVSNL